MSIAYKLLSLLMTRVKAKYWYFVNDYDSEYCIIKLQVYIAADKINIYLFYLLMLEPP